VAAHFLLPGAVKTLLDAGADPALPDGDKARGAYNDAWDALEVRTNPDLMAEADPTHLDQGDLLDRPPTIPRFSVHEPMQIPLPNQARPPSLLSGTAVVYCPRLLRQHWHSSSLLVGITKLAGCSRPRAPAEGDTGTYTSPSDWTMSALARTLESHTSASTLLNGRPLWCSTNTGRTRNSQSGQLTESDCAKLKPAPIVLAREVNSGGDDGRSHRV
jgi:hypothetical protein